MESKKIIKKCAYCREQLIETTLGFTHEQDFCDLKCHNLWKSSQEKTIEILAKHKKSVEDTT